MKVIDHHVAVAAGRHRRSLRYRYLTASVMALVSVGAAALTFWPTASRPTPQPSTALSVAAGGPQEAPTVGPLILVAGRLVPVLDHLDTQENR